jgi:hypothetical protein
MVKLKRKINLIKGQKNKKEDQIIKKKTIYHKFGLNDEIENHQNFYKKIKEKKLEI